MKEEDDMKYQVKKLLIFATATIIYNIRLLSKDMLMDLDHALTDEFIRRMIADKGMEAQP